MVPDIPDDILEEGDLIFRRGQGFTSRVVLAADKDGIYSHVGIIVKDTDGWKVIHVVPGETDDEHPEERIKKETVAQFFAPGKSLSGAIFRYDTVNYISVKAASKARELLERNIFFDHQFNLEDSAEMYCTELVYFVYMNAGIDLTEGRRSSYPGFRTRFILPRDIADNDKLKRVFQYNQYQLSETPR